MVLSVIDYVDSREVPMTYRYEACNRQGEHIQGEIEAGSRQEAAHKIRRQGLWITALANKDRKTTGVKDYFKGVNPFTPVVDDTQIALFFRQMAVLLGAGIPVHEALKSLLAGGRQGSYTRLLEKLYQQVLKGKSLSAAMEECHTFSPRIIRLVSAGESAGTLEETFSRLADFLAQMVKNREQLKSVLLYPAIIGVTALVVLIFMTVFILPAFASMLNNLQTELPLPTKILLGLSDFLQGYGLETAAGGGMLAFGLYGLFRLSQVRYYGHRLLLSLPFLGSLAVHVAWSLVFRTLAMLLEQGVSLHTAIKMAAPVTGNRYIEKELLDLQAKVEQGSSLLAALQDCHAFPPMLYEMLEAGEQAGQLEVMLGKAAAFCQVLAENESSRLQALAEPAAIFTVGGLVFFMVMAVIMPLLNTMDALSM